MTDLSERTHRVQGPRESSGRIRYEGVEVPKEQIDKLEAALESALEGEVRFSIGDRALYAKLRDYLVRVDDDVTCKTCQKRFEIPSHQTMVFLDERSAGGSPGSSPGNDDDDNRGNRA